jgi:hypothetical protein
MSHILLTILAGTESPVRPGNIPKVGAGSGELKIILDLVFGIVGALSILMITISGLRYVLSAGDPQKAARAREGLIYSLVGLLIALAAGAIVTFVIGSL